MSEQLAVTLTVAQLEAVVQRAVSAAASSPYWTQDDSPLGRERHCELLRAGIIKGWKRGRTWFARKVDVQAWIESDDSEQLDDAPELVAIRQRLEAAGAHA